MISSTAAIRIVLADDHEIFRDGFKLILKKQNDIKLVGQATNGIRLIELTEKFLPDVVITDISMPAMNGIEATKLLTKKFPGINILALSMSDDDQSIIAMLEAGVKGYVLKSVGKNIIIEAIKTVYARQNYYCEKITARLVKMIAQNKINPYKEVLKPEFSAKEIEIIKLICQEATNKEMSSKLGLSLRTIEGYREKIQKKLLAKNSVGVVIYAIKAGIHKI